jgi:hypothetical protein
MAAPTPEELVILERQRQAYLVGDRETVLATLAPAFVADLLPDWPGPSHVDSAERDLIFGSCAARPWPSARCEVVFRQPVAQAWRQEQLLVAVAGEEVLRHDRMLQAGPDGLALVQQPRRESG